MATRRWVALWMLSLYAGFDPESGEIFEILSGNISGAFADVDLPTLGDGLFFKLDQEANGVFLDVEGSTSGGGNGGGSTTAPEPAEWILLLSGLFGLFAVEKVSRDAINRAVPNVPSATHTRAPDQYHVRSAHARAWFPMAHAE